MNILKYTSILAASLAAALPISAMQQQKSNLYKDGDRACMVGDSITASGAYTLALMTYYITRLPDTNIDFRNLGLSGDYCGGILHRMQSDILPNFDKQRSVGVLMVGMNDAKRENFSKKTLEKLVYLTHGAYWAIGSLASIMLLATFLEIPEIVTGSIGMAFILASLVSSIIESRRSARAG